MLQEKIKTALCWILTVICMGVIFWLSSRTSVESSAQSGAVLEWLKNIFGDNIFTDFIVRKSAHCLEFTGLSFLFSIAFYQTLKRKCPFYSIALTSLYAATDEFHQLFVEGRSCQIGDWAIDTAGAVLGVVGFTILYKIITLIIIKRKENIIDIKNN